MLARLKFNLFAVLAILSFNQTVHAGFLIEPYLGFVSGEQKQATTAKFTGTEYGARLGYSMLGFAIGAEYAAGSFSDDQTPKSDITMSDIGLFVAYNFPVLVRAYATYVPSSELKVNNSGLDSTLKSGNSMKLGVGFTGFPIINVNLEYISSSYSKIDTTIGAFDLDPKSTGTAFALSISAPFNLF